MTFLDSSVEATDKSAFCGSTRVVHSIKTVLSNVLISLPAAPEKMYSASNLHVGFSKREASQQLSGLFMSD